MWNYFLSLCLNETKENETERKKRRRKRRREFYSRGRKGSSFIWDYCLASAASVEKHAAEAAAAALVFAPKGIWKKMEI